MGTNMCSEDRSNTKKNQKITLNKGNNYPQKLPSVALYLVVSAAEVFCGLPIVGVIGIICVLVAGSALSAGDLRKYLNRMKFAKLVITAGAVAELLLTVLILVLMVSLYN